jgi:hypothetical protein
VPETHEILTLGRLRPNENVDDLVGQLAAQLVAGVSVLPGHLAIFTVYASTGDAEVASRAIAFVVLAAMVGRAQVVERHSGPVHELPPPARRRNSGAVPHVLPVPESPER